MDEFEAARLAGLANLQNRQGIGTLGERSLHAILKYWVDPDASHHEIPLGVGKIVADVFDGQRVVEIQTGSFSALRPKLERILSLYPVTVIYPIAYTKRLIWVNPESGETAPPRKSPKTGSEWDAFHELVYIRHLLTHPQLMLRLVFLDMEEYKLLDGWSRDKKKGAHRAERIPTALRSVVDLRSAEDFAALLPIGLPDPFTSGDLAKNLRISKRYVQKIINVLYTVGAVIRTGKKGNSFLYKSL